MADFIINIFLDDEKISKLGEAGLTGQIKEIEGKKAIQVLAGEKEQKKLIKTYNVQFDNKNQTVLPKEGEDLLFKMVVDNKTTDIIKVFITVAHKPLAGKGLIRGMH